VLVAFAALVGRGGHPAMAYAWRQIAVFSSVGELTAASTRPARPRSASLLAHLAAIASAWQCSTADPLCGRPPARPPARSPMIRCPVPAEPEDRPRRDR